MVSRPRNIIYLLLAIKPKTVCTCILSLIKELVSYTLQNRHLFFHLERLQLKEKTSPEKEKNILSK
jgi:hypothetical protein